MTASAPSSRDAGRDSLRARMATWWAPPRDPFTVQRLQIARKVEWFALLLVLGLAALLPFRRDLTWVDFALYPGIAALLLAMLLLRPRFPGLAGFLASAGFITLVTGAAWFREGLSSGVTSGAIALAVVVTGLLWGPKKTYVVAAFGSLAAASLAWGCPIPAASPLRSWSEITAILLTLAMFVELSLSAWATRTIELELAAKEKQKLEAQLTRSKTLEALGRLSGGIAHDFNNLLTIILGSTDVLLHRSTLEENDRKALLSVVDAAERAAELTSQLLAFGRRQMLQPIVFCANDSLERLRRLLARLVPSGIELRILLAEDLALICMDPARLEQVLVNLVSNAVDALPTGGQICLETANLHISRPEPGWRLTSAAPPPGPYVAVTVTDSGVGMTPEVLEQIFEPFFTTKLPGKGTGLGLATVLGIMAQSNGFIRVRSERGHGTRFQLLFPEVQGQRESLPSRTSGYVSGRPPHSEPSQKVLLVDDNGGVRASLASMLEALGHRVRLAASGDEALQVLATEAAVDLMLTDIVMPSMTGLQLLRAARQLRPSLPVLLMTGYADDVLEGADPELKLRVHTIYKPFTASELEARVAVLLSEESAPAQSPIGPGR